MLQHDFSPLEEIDVTFPTRSALFDVPPIHTAQGPEALTSYLVRLARAHCVTPRDLVKRVFGDVDSTILRLAHNTFYVDYAATVNGLGQHASHLVALTNRLTTRTDLTTLTMLRWKDIVPEQSEGFIARRPRWCPDCFYEQIAQGLPTSSPLVWFLAPYRQCTVHSCLLEEVCGHCGRSQPFIPRVADASVCSHCRGSLAVRRVGNASGTSPVELTRFDGYERILEEMVVAHTRPSTAMTRELFCATLTRIVASDFEGSRIKLCREMGWNKWAINRWLDRGERISLPKLLQLSSRFDMPIIDLCSESGRGGPLPSNRAAPRITSRARRPQLTQHQHQRYLDDLAAKISAEVPPSSLREAGATYGLTRSALRYWFPDQCKRISERGASARHEAAQRANRDRAKLIAESVRALIQAGVRPTRRRIDQEIKAYGLALARPAVFHAYTVAAREAEFLTALDEPEACIEPDSNVQSD